MSQRLITRVAGDIGPPITVEHRHVNVNGWTITARFTKPDGTLYILAANVTASGDGADAPAEYYFQFAAGHLTVGDHLFDFHYSADGIDDYSFPPQHRFIMTVCNG